jgi:phenylalanyl-tRNA synthetase beta chain
MPTVTFSKKSVEELMGKKLPLEELKDRISMLGTDLEKIEGDEIVVEIFPNRPDMLSEAGFARALSAFTGIRPGLRTYEVKKSKGYKVNIDGSVKDVRPNTACAVVKNVNFDEERIREFIQLQEKLHVTFGRNRKKLAIGIYPLEHIKMPIRYLAKDPSKIRFRPLDSDIEMTGKEILHDHPAGREYAHLLDGKPLYPVFEDGAGEILSMPPIINSHKTGRITEQTRDVFVECSGFDRRVLEQCINIITASLSDLGGEIYGVEVSYGNEKFTTPDLMPKEMKLDKKYISKMIGLDISDSALKDLLARMGHGLKGTKVLIPAYRTDILHPIDVAEDIAIAYGYENFEPELPNVATVGEEDGLEVFKSRIANILVGLGLVETLSYHLSDKETDINRMLADNDPVELANSLTRDRSILRSWILPSLMQILSENTNREYPQKIFEMGVTFRKDQKTSTGVDERQQLSIVLCGQDNDFTSARQVIELLMAGLGIEFSLEKVDHPSMIPGRAASIVSGSHRLGFLGELHPQVLVNYSLTMPAAAIEIDLKGLYELLLS